MRAFDLALGGELGLHAPDVVVNMVEEGVLDVGDGILAVEPARVFVVVVVERTEALLKQVVVDEGFGHELLLEAEAVGLDFGGRHGQRGCELAQQTMDGVGGNLPDAEEAEDVVDAVG